MSRAIKRSMLRKQYERFVQAWDNEKRYQKYLLADGQQLEEGHQQLGKKPTFKMWLDAVKNKQMSKEGLVDQQTETVSVESTNWEE